MFKYNLCTYFILPLAKVSHTEFDGFENCYLGEAKFKKASPPIITDHRIFVVAKNYVESPNLVDFFEYKGRVVSIYDLSNHWKSLNEFAQGKYSKYGSKEYKKLIKYSKFPFNQTKNGKKYNHAVFHILHRSKHVIPYRNIELEKLRNKIGIKNFDINDEFWIPPNMDTEIINF